MFVKRRKTVNVNNNTLLGNQNYENNNIGLKTQCLHHKNNCNGNTEQVSNYLRKKCFFLVSAIMWLQMLMTDNSFCCCCC
jgi:hypothetical protein